LKVTLEISALLMERWSFFCVTGEGVAVFVTHSRSEEFMNCRDTP
jgi:hypothetical protein